MQGDKYKTCKYCAYAAMREPDDKKVLSWCSIRCTYNSPETDIKERRLTYRYPNSTCEHFLGASIPQL